MDKFITSVPGVALTNAGKNKRIVRFEEHDLIYFGPRTGENIIKLISLLHTPASAPTK
jgi:iron complex transport system substrate-binding protein